MKYLSFLIILFSVNAFSADYKSAVRLKEGDVISAEVFNDILDRIELSLITPTSTDLLGTWDVIQTTTANGCLGNGGSCSTTGYGTVVDSLYKQRTDSVTFTDDGDGTFSLQTANYCAFIQGPGNSNCNLSYAMVDGRLLVTYDGANYAYVVDKISPTRILLSVWATGSQSFSTIRLDKKSLAPNPPTALSASLSGSSVSLTWTASEGGATSYTVKAKTSATGTYSDVVTNNSGTTYTDTLSSGTKWYRVFAVDSNGTSIGSNVISVTR